MVLTEQHTDALLAEVGTPGLDRRIARMQAADPKTPEQQQLLDRARVAQILSERNTGE